MRLPPAKARKNSGYQILRSALRFYGVNPRTAILPSSIRLLEEDAATTGYTFCPPSYRECQKYRTQIPLFISLGKSFLIRTRQQVNEFLAAISFRGTRLQLLPTPSLMLELHGSLLQSRNSGNISKLL